MTGISAVWETRTDKIKARKHYLKGTDSYVLKKYDAEGVEVCSVVIARAAARTVEVG